MTRLTDLAGIAMRLKALSADLAHKFVSDAMPVSETYKIGSDLDAIILKHETKSFGKSEDDDELVKFLDGVVGVVEADSYAQHMLWTEYADQAARFGYKERGIRFPWEQGMMGHGRQVGMIDAMPVMISLSVNVVDGHRLLFYYGMSRVVDHEMIRDWLTANLPPTAFRNDGHINNEDAMNFCNIVNRVNRARQVEPSDRLETGLAS